MLKRTEVYVSQDGCRLRALECLIEREWQSNFKWSGELFDYYIVRFMIRKKGEILTFIVCRKKIPYNENLWIIFQFQTFYGTFSNCTASNLIFIRQLSVNVWDVSDTISHINCIHWKQLHTPFPIPVTVARLLVFCICLSSLPLFQLYW